MYLDWSCMSRRVTQVNQSDRRLARVRLCMHVRGSGHGGRTARLRQSRGSGSDQRKLHVRLRVATLHLVFSFFQHCLWHWLGLSEQQVLISLVFHPIKTIVQSINQLVANFGTYFCNSLVQCPHNSAIHCDHCDDHHQSPHIIFISKRRNYEGRDQPSLPTTCHSLRLRRDIICCLSSTWTFPKQVCFTIWCSFPCTCF